MFSWPLVGTPGCTAGTQAVSAMWMGGVKSLAGTCPIFGLIAGLAAMVVTEPMIVVQPSDAAHATSCAHVEPPRANGTTTRSDRVGQPYRAAISSARVHAMAATKVERFRGKVSSTDPYRRIFETSRTAQGPCLAPDVSVRR